MNLGILTLFLLAYGVMYALPYIFFKSDGRMNAKWWLTGSPFGVSLLIILLGQKGFVTPLVDRTSALGQWLEVAAVPFAAFSIALQCATMATHRIPLALWHQQNDAPKSIVTWGPYGKVRHPFYVAFLMLQIGSVLVFPHWGTLAAFAASLIGLTLTASREERRLLASQFGTEYADYLKRTGRFVPRLSAGN